MIRTQVEQYSIGKGDLRFGNTKSTLKRRLANLISHPGQVLRRYKNRVQNRIVGRIRGYKVPILAHNYEMYFNVGKGGIVVDVGAHIGLFSLSVANRANKVVAIEPEPRNLLALRHNMQRHDNVIIVEKAAWNRKTRLPLFLNANSEGHSVVSDSQVGNKSALRKHQLMIEADTLDNILSDLGISHVNFIKMDIEGAEIEAIEGAAEILKKTSKIVVASYHKRKGVKTVEAVNRQLSNAGFRTLVASHDFVFGINGRYL